MHYQNISDNKYMSLKTELVHITNLIGRVCGAKRPHSVSEQPIYHLSV